LTGFAEVECDQNGLIGSLIGWGVNREAESGPNEVFQIINTIVNERDARPVDTEFLLHNGQHEVLAKPLRQHAQRRAPAAGQEHVLCGKDA
jgi:hypothetical protein